MSEDRSPHWVYNETIRRFAAGESPLFEDPAEMTATWGRAWGVDNDIGRIRAVLVHRPGPEMAVIDPAKRLADIGSFGDPEAGWYFQSDSVPEIAEMQAQHDTLVAALKAEDIEVFEVSGVEAPRLKSCYTRDPLVMVKGGAIVSRMGARVRRGEERAITRTLGEIGVPILRTLDGAALFEGGSFAWIDPNTAVIGCGIRVNREGARQVGEVLANQGVELLVIDLVGYDLHIDGAFLMVDPDLALIDPDRLPYSFLATLKEKGIRMIEIGPGDTNWIVNSLAVAPGRLVMPEGGSNRTLDKLAAAGVTWTVVPYDKMQLNGGGIHCSTMPLIRDPI
ncbi:MAG: arginine deiminase family protein [Pseudomonadota bacterium]